MMRALLMFVLLSGTQNELNCDALAINPSFTLRRRFVRPSNGAYDEFIVVRNMTPGDSITSKLNPYLLFPGGGYVPNHS